MKGVMIEGGLGVPLLLPLARDDPRKTEGRTDRWRRAWEDVCAEASSSITTLGRQNQQPPLPLGAAPGDSPHKEHR